MTEKETKATKAVLKMEELKAQYVEADIELESALLEIGLDHHWQDGKGIVYRTKEWGGTYVVAKKIECAHTRREKGEKGGLSMVAARELGYVVEGK